MCIRDSRCGEVARGHVRHHHLAGKKRGTQVLGVRVKLGAGQAQRGRLLRHERGVGAAPLRHEAPFLRAEAHVVRLSLIHI